MVCEAVDLHFKWKHSFPGISQLFMSNYKHRCNEDFTIMYIFTVAYTPIHSCSRVCLDIDLQVSYYVLKYSERETLELC